MADVGVISTRVAKGDGGVGGGFGGSGLVGLSLPQLIQMPKASKTSMREARSKVRRLVALTLFFTIISFLHTTKGHH